MIKLRDWIQSEAMTQKQAANHFGVCINTIKRRMDDSVVIHNEIWKKVGRKK